VAQDPPFGISYCLVPHLAHMHATAVPDHITLEWVSDPLLLSIGALMNRDLQQSPLGIVAGQQGLAGAVAQLVRAPDS
jgi:hypothetical protein